jgi:hypothetical protein
LTLSKKKYYDSIEKEVLSMAKLKDELGAALGWYVAALSGLRKTISDFMRSVFYSPAILVTLIWFYQ